MSLIESWQLLLKSSDGHSVVVDAMLSYLVIWYYIFNLQTTITDFIIVKALRYYSADWNNNNNKRVKIGKTAYWNQRSPLWNI